MNKAKPSERRRTLTVGSCMLTLGVGMLAGGVAVLMLPQQSQARKTAQKAVDSLEQAVTDMVQ